MKQFYSEWSYEIWVIIGIMVMGWVAWSGIKDAFDPEDYKNWRPVENFMHRSRTVGAVLMLLVLFYLLFTRLYSYI